MQPLRKFSVFDVKINDKVFNQKTGEYGVITQVKETAHEWVDAFVYWPDTDTEEILEMYDKNLYLVK